MATVPLIRQINNTLTLSPQGFISLPDMLHNIAYLKARAAGNSAVAEQLKTMAERRLNQLALLQQNTAQNNVQVRIDLLSKINLALGLTANAANTLDVIRTLKIAAGEPLTPASLESNEK